MPTHTFRRALLLLLIGYAHAGLAGVVIEGHVTLPEFHPSVVTARYQQISGQIAAPEPPAAIVYLEGSFPAQAGADRAPAQVTQKGYQFAPGLLAIRNGDQVAFPNLDDDYHHVFSYSKAKSFDLGRYKMGEEAPKITFDTAGTITVGCEIHDHMRGTILVLDTPYFTKTLGAGVYRLVIPEALSGSFLLKAWVNDRKVYEQNVELHDGAVLRVDFPGN